MTDSNCTYKLMCRTTEAITLGFDEMIRYDYTMPDPIRMLECEVYAKDEIFPLDCGKRGGDRMHYVHHGRPLCDIGELDIAPRLREGLKLTLDVNCRDDTPGIVSIIKNHEHIWREEWFFGKGCLFAFREGEKDKAQQRVDDYFDRIERWELERLYAPMREHAKTLWK